MKQTKKSIAKKIILSVTAVVLSLVLVLLIGIYAVWHNEISTIMSFKMLRDRNDEHKDGAVYTMDVKGDFYLDEFIVSHAFINIDVLLHAACKGAYSGPGNGL